MSRLPFGFGCACASVLAVSAGCGGASETDQDVLGRNCDAFCSHDEALPCPGAWGAEYTPDPVFGYLEDLQQCRAACASKSVACDPEGHAAFIACIAHATLICGSDPVPQVLGCDDEAAAWTEACGGCAILPALEPKNCGFGVRFYCSRTHPETLGEYDPPSRSDCTAAQPATGVVTTRERVL